MRRNSVVGYLSVLAGFGVAFLLYLSPGAAYAIVAQTTTITGYAIPSATGLSNALIPFILPILVTGLFVLLTHFMSLGGEINSLVIKIGLFIGCLLGMLSLTSSAPTLIPFAFPVVSGVYVVTYVWKKV